jgi:hypothetical protein
VRRHAASQALRTGVTGVTSSGSRSLPRRTYAQLAVASAIAAVGMSVASLLLLDSSSDETCSRDGAHFGTWVTVLAFRAWADAALNAMIWCALAPPPGGNIGLQLPPAAARLMRMRELISWLALAWFIVGNSYISRAGEVCAATVLYRYSLALLILLYIQLLLPLLALLLVMAAVCCCMPAVIRLLVTLGAVQTSQQPATQRQILTLPEEKFRAGRFPDPTCAICMADYEEEEAVRVLPCGGAHHFHKRCVDDWLKINANCPICRGSVLGAGALPSADDAQAAAPAHDSGAAAPSASAGRERPVGVFTGSRTGHGTGAAGATTAYQRGSRDGSRSPEFVAVTVAVGGPDLAATSDSGTPRVVQASGSSAGLTSQPVGSQGDHGAHALADHAVPGRGRASGSGSSVDELLLQQARRL